MLRTSLRSGVSGPKWKYAMSELLSHWCIETLSRRCRNYDDAIRVMQRAAAVPKNTKVNYHDHVRFIATFIAQFLTGVCSPSRCRHDSLSRSNCGRSTSISKSPSGPWSQQRRCTTKSWNSVLQMPRLLSTMLLSSKKITTLRKVSKYTRGVSSCSRSQFLSRYGTFISLNSSSDTYVLFICVGLSV